MPAKCVECGAPINEMRGPIEWEVRGQHVVVPDVCHGICSQCGEIYLPDSASHEVHMRAVDKIKRERGLLSCEEIRALRTSLGLSQAQFEKLIGAGPKTVVRWENGSVFQNKTADTLMRILRDYPTVAADLAHRATA